MNLRKHPSFINGGSIVIVIYLVIESIKNVILPVMIKMIWLFVSLIN